MKRVATLLAAALLTATAQADITDPALTITASNATGTGTYQVLLSQGQWQIGGNWSWQSAAPFEVRTPGGLLVASFESFTCEYVADPVVTLNFQASAGTTQTQFIISSALLSFPALNGAVGTASAGASLTDQNGDGATLSGLHPGNFAYRANYNGLVPAGTTFASLVQTPMVAGPFGTTVASGAVPPTAIGGSVSSMSAQWWFDLSANDAAAGTSVFSIVPAPGTAALLGFGLLALRRRR